MGWVQLGLFLDQRVHIKVKPKLKARAKPSKSKPIPKAKKPKKTVSLAPGELDDPIDF